MTTGQMGTILSRQRRAFHQESVEERLEHLGKLEGAIVRHEKELEEALFLDLGKNGTESYMCETGLALSEIRFIRKHLRGWMKERRVKSTLACFPARSYILHNPWGEVLVMSPWNYPVMLSLEPLAGAIAGGNSVVLKPSAYAPHTASALKQMLDETLPLEKVATILGGRKENQALLDERFDYIFFTGSPHVGHVVMEKAAKNLTPLTLELGGKSPVIVTQSANLRLAAKRIVFGKLLNMGQTCVAPDYLLVSDKVEERLVSLLKEEMRAQYGGGFTGHIVNETHFDRIVRLIDREKVCYGGKCEREALRIEPTLMRGVTWNDKIMQEEIFGPVLPLITFHDLDEAVTAIAKRPAPLALYIFSEEREEIEKALSLPFGGGCVNDTVIHLSNPHLPFGGVGESGMGRYHGKASFLTFTRQKSILVQSGRLDIPLRYHPYTPWTKRVLKRLF